MHGRLPDLPVLLLEGFDAKLVRLELNFQDLVLKESGEGGRERTYYDKSPGGDQYLSRADSIRGLVAREKLTTVGASITLSLSEKV